MLPPSFNFMVFVFAKKNLEVSYLGSEYQKATKTKTPKKKKKLQVDQKRSSKMHKNGSYLFQTSFLQQVPKSGGGIQRPKGGSCSFGTMGTGTCIASRSSVCQNFCVDIFCQKKWQKKKKNIWVNFNLMCQMFLAYDRIIYSCDSARKITSATSQNQYRISPTKKKRQWNV